jgi:hypothetical protein
VTTLQWFAPKFFNILVEGQKGHDWAAEQQLELKLH